METDNLSAYEIDCLAKNAVDVFFLYPLLGIAQILLDMEEIRRVVEVNDN